jgi:hypothetical protein
MSEQGPHGPRSSGVEAASRAPASARPRGRLGNPTRLIPRRTPSPPAPEIAGTDPIAPASGPDPYAAPSGGRRPEPLFAPRTFGNGRIQVWGLAPGCLIVSLIASVLLTVLLNIVF